MAATESPGLGGFPRQWWDRLDHLESANMSELPSGYVKIASDNGHRNCELSQQKWLSGYDLQFGLFSIAP